MATVYCHKLQKKGEQLDFQPYGGELGQRIMQEICQEAWQLWLEHQTMLINEYRLNLLEPEAKQFLQTELEKFLFGDGSDKPSGFNPIKSK